MGHGLFDLRREESGGTFPASIGEWFVDRTLSLTNKTIVIELSKRSVHAKGKDILPIVCATCVMELRLRDTTIGGFCDHNKMVGTKRRVGKVFRDDGRSKQQLFYLLT